MASYQVSVPKNTCHHRLICQRKDDREYSTPESHKSVSYQTATEWGDETDRYKDKIRIDLMIVQVVLDESIAKDNLTRYIVTPLLLKFYSRSRNLLRHNRSKRKRAEVISDNLSQPCYYIVNGDCLNRNAARLLGLQTYENPVWQRSFRSSLSKGKPCTWRREAANNLI